MYYIVREKIIADSLTKDKEVNIMPSIELIEREKVTYVKEMQEYLNSLKKMSDKDAKKLSQENLIKSQIIQDDGEFSERYRFSRINSQNKG